MEITSTARIRVDVRMAEPQRFDVVRNGERVRIEHVWHADTLSGNSIGAMWGNGVAYRKDGTLGVARRTQVLLHEHDLPTHVLVALRDGHAQAVARIRDTVSQPGRRGW